MLLYLAAKLEMEQFLRLIGLGEQVENSRKETYRQLTKDDLGQAWRRRFTVFCNNNTTLGQLGPAATRAACHCLSPPGEKNDPHKVWIAVLVGGQEIEDCLSATPPH